NEERKVITLENPVESKIPGVTQVEVNLREGQTFGGELGSALLQFQPEVIYVGEIRDEMTADIACRAAQADHLILTTLPANDAISGIARLIALGVEPELVASALTGVLGQRLVRVLCPNCKVRYTPDPELLRKANLPADRIKFLYKPRLKTP